MNGFVLRWLDLGLSVLGLFFIYLNVSLIKGMLKTRRTHAAVPETTGTIIGTSEILPVSRSTPMSNWKWLTNNSNSNSNRGWTRIAGAFVLTTCVGFIVLGVISLPVEKAAIINQTATTGPLYLPHVAEDLDQYHFYADPNRDSSKRMYLTFCDDKGFRPPFAEGQTLAWMKYKAWDKCLELIGADCVRDLHHNCVGD